MTNTKQSALTIARFLTISWAIIGIGVWIISPFAGLMWALSGVIAFSALGFWVMSANRPS